ncbi:MAG: sigma-54-dependent transcriptional regulator [Phaeodactylibacter xiamenensis]|uniref:Fis family transcriptional regulator n=1 Tax=Phaeodactylibacter xiamenensis TaxID=1524460 RepID=A0A098S8U4_9BACT|nr:sigma-54 dependent transcriptional regulator [Phaeodactylibacter xiamenensis]KGE88078.1 Fis family transcriptional regulator [Phaeodactylibacter xiamenensis]MCR9052163.1 sigma-54 dependent transcriptional regulator [bacterium]
MKKRSILLVDDSQDMLEVLRRQLNALQYNTFQSTSVTDAIDLLQHARIDLLITDMRMPGLDGMHLVKYAKSNFPDLPVLVITGFPSVSGAVEAVKSGALDYLSKPFTAKELQQAVQQVFRQQDGKTDTTVSTATEEEQTIDYHGIIGQSQPVMELIDLIERIKDTRATTLIQGESGTGKELVARAIHYSGPYRQAPFVTVNCGAIPEHLLESELFGFVKGAFTGANETRPGFFHAADGGTIFLDEIGNASAAVQTRLLRVIQEKEVKMVGTNTVQKVDLRVIAATNSDLYTLSQQGQFREDLYYRLHVIDLHTPPLRQRKSDLPLLIRHFLDKYAKSYGRPKPGVTPEAMHRLKAHDWPGNIRELENAVQRALILCDGQIEVADLPAYLHAADHTLRTAQPQALLSLREMEQQHIRRVLDAVDGNKTAAAKILGINRKTLRIKLKE